DLSGGIATDGSGQAYLGGTASAGFPTSARAAQAAVAGSTNAFLVCIDTTKAGAASIKYSTVIGGAGADSCLTVACRAGGIGFLAGIAGSADFPVKQAIQSNPGGGLDGFLAKFDIGQPGAASLLFNTRIGGNGDDIIHAVAVDQNGDIY